MSCGRRPCTWSSASSRGWRRRARWAPRPKWPGGSCGRAWGARWRSTSCASSGLRQASTRRVPAPAVPGRLPDGRGGRVEGLPPAARTGQVGECRGPAARPLQRWWHLLCHRRHLHPSGRPALGGHPRGRCRHLPVARCPLLRSRWPSPRPTGSTERHVVPGAGHGWQYRNRVLKVPAPCSSKARVPTT